MAIKGIFATCNLHGTEVFKGVAKMVRVPLPRNRNDRKNGGCPVCKKERLQAEKALAELAKSITT